MAKSSSPSDKKSAWNKGRVVGAKSIFTPDQIQMIKLRLAQERKWRDWLLFSLGINGRLREGDLLSLKVSDVANEHGIRSKGLIRQEKTGRQKQFVIPKETQNKLRDYITANDLQFWDYLFYGRKRTSKPISKRQLLVLVKQWASLIGLDPSEFGTHSLRRSGADYLYRRTHNIRAVQLVLEHKSIETTIRYLGIDKQEALDLTELYPL